MSFHSLTQNTYICGDVGLAVYTYNSVDLESSIKKSLFHLFLINHEIPQQDLNEIKALKCQLIILSLT